MPSKNKENWSGGEDYDYFMGRWSQKTAQKFVGWLNPKPNLTWLDIGCGTGALTQAILNDGNKPQALYAIDPSWSFVHHTQITIKSKPIACAVSFADNIPLINGLCDYIVSGLMLNFTPNPVTSVKEMRRVTRLGGTVAAYVWDYAGDMQWLRHFWDAALAIDASAEDYDEGKRFPLCHPKELENTFLSAGLKNVEVVALDIETIFPDFEAYWSPFLTGNFPAPHYLKNLSAPKQDELKTVLKERLPIADDGHIHLIARAWAVRGSKT